MTRAMEKFTLKQVQILMVAIIAGIAFIETSSPIWTLDFLREFFLKFIGYAAVSIVVVMIVGEWIDKHH